MFVCLKAPRYNMNNDDSIITLSLCTPINLKNSDISCFIFASFKFYSTKNGRFSLNRFSEHSKLQLNPVNLTDIVNRCDCN